MPSRSGTTTEQRSIVPGQRKLSEDTKAALSAAEDDLEFALANLAKVSDSMPTTFTERRIRLALSSVHHATRRLTSLLDTSVRYSSLPQNGDDCVDWSRTRFVEGH
jgi:hypothetical protein